MTTDLVGHASGLELIWLALSGSGLVLAFLNGLEAVRDWQALGGKINGRRAIAVGNLRREIVRGLIQLAWVLIGLLAAAAPSSGPPSPMGAVISVVLVLSAAGMTLNSYLDRRDRLYLLHHGVQPRDEQGRFTKT